MRKEVIWFNANLVSLKTASITIVITFILGLLAAWWIYSRKSEALKMVFDGIFTLPMVLPPTVAGFFLLMIFGVNQPIGKFLYECIWCSHRI